MPDYLRIRTVGAFNLLWNRLPDGTNPIKQLDQAKTMRSTWQKIDSNKDNQSQQEEKMKEEPPWHLHQIWLSAAQIQQLAQPPQGSALNPTDQNILLMLGYLELLPKFHQIFPGSFGPL
jgi:hypothetical protein